VHMHAFHPELLMLYDGDSDGDGDGGGGSDSHVLARGGNT
jgi:hypothetical protein